MSKEVSFLFNELTKRVQEICSSSATVQDKLDLLVHVLKNDVPHYNWVGFYLTDTTQPHMLVLGPYAGEATDHTHIPFGKGICGQAAATQKTFVVQDVSKESNYLSCSIHVKSEIVVPILKDGEILGELDIDSHHKNIFKEEDRIFLENVCALVANIYTKNLFS